MANGEHMSNMVTVREVARLLHVHLNTLRRMSNKGRVRVYRITSRGNRRYKRQEIVQFMAELHSHADNWHDTETRQRSQK
jgi:excisionase family DNA binding protein